MSHDFETTGGSAAWRQFIPDESYPRFSKEFLANATTYEWLQDRLDTDPFVGNWIGQWKERLSEPYRGITTDGKKRGELFELTDTSPDPSSFTYTLVSAAEKFLDLLTEGQKKDAQLGIDAPELRAWSNPELYVFRHGLRLDEISEQIVNAVHKVLKASLSEVGYNKVNGCMKVNHFLGEVVDAHKVLNSGSYNFTIFGNPSIMEPWAWQLTGHHLCLNHFIVGSQQVLSPVFMGAEPNIVDTGPDRGLCLFNAQESAGIEVMRALHEGQRNRVRIFESVTDPTIPEWRIHRADQRHLGGAFQDNRVIPYEGLLVHELPSPAQDAIRKIIRLNFEILPPQSLNQKLEEIQLHWDETYFCWIGGWEVGDVFYYKIHSPITMLEFDHHSGVFLTNREPRSFHIHTLIRTPNGNDYGKELLEQYRSRHTRSLDLGSD